MHLQCLSLRNKPEQEARHYVSRASRACPSSSSSSYRFLLPRRFDWDLTRLHLLSHRNVNIQHTVMQLAFDLIHVKILRQRDGGVKLPIRNLGISAGSPPFGSFPLAFENELVALRRHFQTILGNARDDGAQQQFILIPAGLDYRRERIPAVAARVAVHGTGARTIEIIEELVHRTTEVVQRLSHITREHSVEHTLQPPFVKFSTRRIASKRGNRLRASPLLQAIRSSRCKRI